MPALQHLLYKDERRMQEYNLGFDYSLLVD